MSKMVLRDASASKDIRMQKTILMDGEGQITQQHLDPFGS